MGPLESNLIHKLSRSVLSVACSSRRRIQRRNFRISEFTARGVVQVQGFDARPLLVQEVRDALELLASINSCLAVCGRVRAPRDGRLRVLGSGV